MFACDEVYKNSSEMCNAMAEDILTDSCIEPTIRHLNEDEGVTYDLARALEKYLPRWREQINKFYSN